MHPAVRGVMRECGVSRKAWANLKVCGNPDMPSLMPVGVEINLSS
jgi:hypothetical protein